MSSTPDPHFPQPRVQCLRRVRCLQRRPGVRCKRMWGVSIPGLGGQGSPRGAGLCGGRGGAPRHRVCTPSAALMGVRVSTATRVCVRTVTRVCVRTVTRVCFRTATRVVRLWCRGWAGKMGCEWLWGYGWGKGRGWASLSGALCPVPARPCTTREAGAGGGPALTRLWTSSHWSVCPQAHARVCLRVVLQ